ncbi:MAG: 30S ribosomal protein S21 [Desulfobacterales bacterium]|nr:30S ribosomal protein S21 [Desulfobacterales bacterium]
MILLAAEYGERTSCCQDNCTRAPRAGRRGLPPLNFSCQTTKSSVYHGPSDPFFWHYPPGEHSLQPAGGTKGAMWVKEIEVKVIDNDIEKAMRILKKKIQNDGLFKRLKLKKSYEKPSEFRRRKQREAHRRERIAAARAARRR